MPAKFPPESSTAAGRRLLSRYPSGRRINAVARGVGYFRGAVQHAKGEVVGGLRTTTLSGTARGKDPLRLTGKQ